MSHFYPILVEFMTLNPKVKELLTGRSGLTRGPEVHEVSNMAHQRSSETSGQPRQCCHLSTDYTSRDPSYAIIRSAIRLNASLACTSRTNIRNLTHHSRQDALYHRAF